MATQNLKQCRIDSYCDNRALRYFDIFPEMTGQVTISIVAPNAISGWHRHQHQTDQFFVARGMLRVTSISPGGDVVQVVLNSKNPSTCTILPEHWHGWRSYNEEVVLCYFLSRKHDEEDEHRATLQEIRDLFGVDL
jgi:dTDP-4-dehydrorhamnose 3,5-epimerase-like enzyme